ncbi:hypothetical protein [Kitasatospora sp. NPDC094011]|uniref:DUF7848 domain-containing protein n=1 Tax=Kitasatospora sp. NPDC094011 TaxID=3364090 RepID=UPI0037F83858
MISDATNRALGVALHQSWTIAADTGASTPFRYVLACVSEDEDGKVCGADSGEVGDMPAVVEWVQVHASAVGEDHRSYQLLAEIPMEAIPGVVSP